MVGGWCVPLSHGWNIGLILTPTLYNPIISADVKDIPGDTFRVLASDKTITVLTGAAKGAVFSPGTPVYDQVIKNLVDAGNKFKLSLVLGTLAVEDALKSAPLATSGGGLPPTTAAELVAFVPFWQRQWFWPAMILTGAGTLAVLILFWPPPKR